MQVQIMGGEIGLNVELSIFGNWKSAPNQRNIKVLPISIKGLKTTWKPHRLIYRQIMVCVDYEYEFVQRVAEACCSQDGS